MSKKNEMKDFIQIGDSYRVTSDGTHNLILHEKYERMEGRGKNTKPTGVFDYRWLGYFRNLGHIGRFLSNLEEFKGIYEGGKEEEMINRIEKLRDDIVKAMSEANVTWIK